MMAVEAAVEDIDAVIEAAEDTYAAEATTAAANENKESREL